MQADASGKQRIRPYVSVESTKPAVTVQYKRVRLPSFAEISAACHLAASMQQQVSDDGHKLVDATLLVDVCMRFTCLAYRRNMVHGKRKSAVSVDVFEGGVELQVNDRRGAHAVIYLLGGAHQSGGDAPRRQRMHAVVTFKGSTANRQDWTANFKSTTSTSQPLYTGAEALVHPGWLGFLEALVEALEQFEVRHLPAGAAVSLGLHADSSASIWDLLASEHCERVLLVGHSLGGALACLAATKLGVAAAAASAAERATLAAGTSGAAEPLVTAEVATERALPPTPLLVTFGCPIVGNAAFVALQNGTVAPAGGLRVFNHFDPVPSVGSGFVSVLHAVGRRTAWERAHAGLPVELHNLAALQVPAPPPPPPQPPPHPLPQLSSAPLGAHAGQPAAQPPHLRRRQFRGHRGRAVLTREVAEPPLPALTKNATHDHDDNSSPPITSDDRYVLPGLFYAPDRAPGGMSDLASSFTSEGDQHDAGDAHHYAHHNAHHHDASDARDDALDEAWSVSTLSPALPVASSSASSSFAAAATASSSAAAAATAAPSYSLSFLSKLSWLRRARPRARCAAPEGSTSVCDAQVRSLAHDDRIDEERGAGGRRPAAESGLVSLELRARHEEEHGFAGLCEVGIAVR